MVTLYPFQQAASDAILQAIDDGEPGIVLTAPPRAGKTILIQDVIRRVSQRNWRTTIYSHRILLTKQLVRSMVTSDIDVGVRAAGWDIDDDPLVQIASMQTEHSQVMRRGARELSTPNLVVVDELHLQCGAMAQEIYRRHQKHGAVIVGMTATPVDIPTDLFTRLIAATTNSELRAIGQHVPCITYGCEEIDTSKIKAMRDGNFSAAELRKAFKVWQIYGYVLNHWRRLNPEQKPTILFAPGVKESLWFAQEFAKAGIAAVHIDGGHVYFNESCPRYGGESFKGQAGLEKRSAALDMSEQREIKIITNRYVLREAIDCPWLEVGIGATVFGALHSFIQAGSRILTASPGKTHATWIDHGGCLDSKTEILTKRGWAGRKQIADDDLVAAFDRSSNTIHWEPILQRHDRPLEPGEQMFEIKSRCCDIRVTGNHRFVFEPWSYYKASKPREYRLERADVLCNSPRMVIPISGHQSKQPTGLSLSDDEIRFIGWWLTDGTMCRTDAKITQSEHQPQLADHLGQYLDKSLPLALDDADDRQFAILLHAIHLGNGDKGKFAATGNYRIAHGNESFADRLQSMCIRRGYACSIHRFNHQNFRIDIRHNTTTTTIRGMECGNLAHLKPSSSEVGERVWCVANRLETLVTRRNGRVAIIGNSHWRHGSLNEDREWHLGCTASEFASIRRNQFISGEAEEPSICPQCNAVRGPQWHKTGKCPKCGFAYTESVRPVLQADGTLKKIRGPVHKQRRLYKHSHAAALWRKHYFRCKNKSMTFSQAEALFAKEHSWRWLPRTLPLMPTTAADWVRKIHDVPAGSLYNDKTSPYIKEHPDQAMEKKKPQYSALF